MKGWYHNKTACLSPAQFVTAAYLLLLLSLTPLVVHRGYFDITEAKHACFVVLSIAYLLCMLGVWAASCVRFRRWPSPRLFLKGLHTEDWCMLGFVGVYALSTALCADPATALFGATNRYQGLLTILLYGAIWFCISRSFAFLAINEIALVAAFCLVCLMTVLQGFGLDPLDLQAGLRPFDRLRYLSTLGNINFYSGYVGMMLAFTLTGWCHGTRWRRVLYGAALLFGAGGALFTGSESFMLSAMLVCLLLPLALIRDLRALKRFFEGLMLLLAVMELIFFLTRAVTPRLYVSFVLKALLKPPVLVVVLSVLAILRLALGKARVPALLRAGRIYRWSLVGGALAAALLLLLANTVWAGRSFGAADRFLKFNENWGTDRGMIWRACMGHYRDFDPLHKLIGGGSGCVCRLVGKSVFPGSYLDSAHNEYLQYLLTAGLLGLGCYVGMLITLCRAAARNAWKRPLMLAVLMGVVCYAAQAVVNIAQPASTPYLFALLAMLRGMVGAEERPAGLQ